MNMKVTRLVIALTVLAATTVHGFDKYQDALEKYRRWQELHGGGAAPDNFVRVQRQTKRKTSDIPGQQRNRIDQFVLKNAIPQGDSFAANFNPGGSSIDPFNNVIEESEVNFLRPVRTPAPAVFTQGGPGSEYIHSSGVPLYKIRNRYPHGYGRKKRSALPQGWVLLDPSTGRPKDTAIEIPAVLRRERQPLDEGQQSPLDALSRQLLNVEPAPAWDYKFYKNHPYTG